MSDGRIVAAFAALVLATVTACLVLVAIGWWPMAVAVAWIVYAHGPQPFYRLVRWRDRG